MVAMVLTVARNHIKVSFRDDRAPVFPDRKSKPFLNIADIVVILRSSGRKKDEKDAGY
jgi:hypothetical protein